MFMVDPFEEIPRGSRGLLDPWSGALSTSTSAARLTRVLCGRLRADLFGSRNSSRLSCARYGWKERQQARPRMTIEVFETRRRGAQDKHFVPELEIKFEIPRFNQLVERLKDCKMRRVVPGPVLKMLHCQEQRRAEALGDSATGGIGLVHKTA